MPKTFYLTTTLPYVNADPHIGFAFELVSADIIARYQRITGREVFFNTGTDEHGVKIYRKAQEEGKETQEYVDEYAAKYRALIAALGVSPDIHFIRTTDAAHKKAAQEFWRRCRDNGFIDKKPYKIKYCVGCELEKTESELEDGKCPIHPHQALEVIEEENWFFKLSDPRVVEHLDSLYARTDFVIPDFRLNELRSLMREKGLEDFSISRLKTKMPWGVPVPDDETQVMYVWMDALVNYISAIGWPNNMKQFTKWWVESGGVVQLAGKDQVRQQAAMWQGMLFAAGLSPSQQIVIHGFIQTGGQKMSKSLGNTIDPFALVNEYGTDAVRFYLARHIHPFEDSDFTLEKFKEAYNADLANGLGNLTARLLQMSASYLSRPIDIPVFANLENLSGTGKVVLKHLDSFEIQKAAFAIWSWMQDLDDLIQEQKPFEVAKTNKVAAEKQLKYMLKQLAEIAFLLQPFMPETSKKIISAIRANKKPENLFPRK